MNRIKKELFFFLTVLLFLSGTLSPGMELDGLEWKVKVGDSTTFELVKYYDKTDLDGDGDINTFTFLITDENGNLVNITWRVGSKVKYVISTLNDSGAYLERTYDGKVTGLEVRTTQVVQKTVDNTTYWEEYAASITTPTRNASVDGNIFTVEESFVLPPLNNTFFNSLKFDWTTGWLINQYQKVFNASTIIGELEFSKVASSAPGFEFPVFLTGFIVLVIVMRMVQIPRMR